MWLRTAEVTIAADALRIRHETVSGPECRLRAALLLFEQTGGADPAATLAGTAWEAPDGGTWWGWPDGDGRVRLRAGPASAAVCSVLPPALSLALAFRRSGSEPGARTLVIGDGFLARVARSVASLLGSRVEGLADPGATGSDQAARPDVVIETTGAARNLEWATERCRDWGRIYSLGGGLMSGPFDYYAQVHCRALAITHVPVHPILDDRDEEIAERGVARLAEALHGIAPAPDTTLASLIVPPGATARLACERSGWGLLLADD